MESLTRCRPLCAAVEIVFVPSFEACLQVMTYKRSENVG